MNEARLAEVKEDLGLPENFDVHALYNLAPACPPCNVAKSNTVFNKRPIVLTQLERARKLAPEILGKIENFRTGSRLSAAILAIIEADADNEDTRTTLLRDGPEIVQKIAMLDPGRADHIETFRHDIYLANCCHYVLMYLNERSRSTKMLFEEVAAGDLFEALKVPMSDILSRASVLAKQTIQARESRGGPEFELIEVNGSEFVLNSFDFQRNRPSTSLHFQAHGEFIVDIVGIVARTSIVDGDLESSQVDATISGYFSFGIHWSMNSPADELTYTSTEITNERVGYVFHDGGPSYYEYG